MVLKGFIQSSDTCRYKRKLMISSVFITDSMYKGFIVALND